MVLKEFLASNV